MKMIMNTLWHMHDDDDDNDGNDDYQLIIADT